MIKKFKASLLVGLVILIHVFPAHAYTAKLSNEFQVAMKDKYQGELAASNQSRELQIASQQERIDGLGKCAVHREVMVGFKDKPCKACPRNLPSVETLTLQSYAAASHYVYFVMALEDQFGVENVNADTLRRQLEDSWSALGDKFNMLYEEASLSTPETVRLNRLCAEISEEVEASDSQVREGLKSRGEPAEGGHFYE